MAKATKNWEFQFREQPLTIANDDHYQVILELIEKHPEFKAGKVWKISFMIYMLYFIYDICIIFSEE